MTGFAFVDSSVTGMGSQAKLPAGAKNLPPGSKVTGTEGCPTNRYHTDGMIVAVIDYQGRPTAASVTITEHPATGGISSVRPTTSTSTAAARSSISARIFENGTYDVVFSYSYNLGAAKTATAELVLARSCR